MLCDEVVRRAFKGTDWIVDHVHVGRKVDYTSPGEGKYLSIQVVLSGDFPISVDVEPWVLLDEDELAHVAKFIVGDCIGYRARNQSHTRGARLHQVPSPS